LFNNTYYLAFTFDEAIRFYHSFTLLASIFRKINNKIVNPKVQILRRRRKVMDSIVGKTPTTIAIFTKKCVNNIPATQP
jgi:hypothetical protein